MSRAHIAAGLILLALAYTLYIGLLPLQVSGVVRPGGRFFEMTGQNPVAGGYATVGALYEVAVSWVVREKPPGEDSLIARFTVAESSTGRTLLSSTASSWQSIPGVGEGYWSWAQGSYTQPDDDVRITCELVGRRTGSVLEVFEWVVHPNRPPNPEQGVVEFDVCRYELGETGELIRVIPVEGAECRLGDGRAYSVSSNVYGKARIEGVEPGVYTVTVYAPGYRIYQTTVTVRSGGGVIVWVRLEPGVGLMQGYTPPSEMYSANPSENPRSGMLTFRELTASYQGWRLPESDRATLAVASALSGLILLLHGLSSRRR
jgi:hypothetical protein